MTPEELLKPRYKVIADWPDNDKGFKIGDILKLRTLNSTKETVLVHGYRDNFGIDRTVTFFEPHFSLYPHLFKKLEWWEDRKPEEMPEYVKHKNVNKIGKVLRWHIGKQQINYAVVEHTTWDISYCLPATSTEYQDYLNQNK